MRMNFSCKNHDVKMNEKIDNYLMLVPAFHMEFIIDLGQIESNLNIVQFDCAYREYYAREDTPKRDYIFRIFFHSDRTLFQLLGM